MYIYLYVQRLTDLFTIQNSSHNQRKLSTHFKCSTSEYILKKHIFTIEMITIKTNIATIFHLYTRRNHQTQLRILLKKCMYFDGGERVSLKAAQLRFCSLYNSRIQSLLIIAINLTELVTSFRPVTPSLFQWPLPKYGPEHNYSYKRLLHTYIPGRNQP